MQVTRFVDTFAFGRTGLDGWVARRRAWLLAMHIVRATERRFTPDTLREQIRPWLGPRCERTLRVESLNGLGWRFQLEITPVSSTIWPEAVQFVRAELARALPLHLKGELKTQAAHDEYMRGRNAFIDDLAGLLLTVVFDRRLPGGPQYALSGLSFWPAGGIK